MIKYECILCDRELVELVMEGWHYCSNCDVEYSKVILTPVHVPDTEETE